MTGRGLPPHLVLEGDFVRLEPLEVRHLAELFAIVDGAPDEFTLTYTPSSPEPGDPYVEKAFEDRMHGWAFPFVILDRQSGSVAGSTRYNGIVLHEGRIEVGFTFLAPRFHGGPHNVEAKLLMFRYAFESLEVNRLQIQADARNTRSIAAIESLGARYEGELRAHSIAADGAIRNTVMFSVLRDEWPAVKELLLSRLERKASRWHLSRQV